MKKNCSELRSDSRAALKGKYWYAFGICILASLIIGIASSIGSLLSNMEGGFETDAGSLTYSLVSLAALIFVNFPITVGLARYFIKASQEEPDMQNLFFPYKNKLGNVIIAEIKQAVFIFLWYLLFIIPGIIKSYSYFMVSYLIAENPGLDTKRAFEISKTAMNGNKGRLFLLQLSFIGWIALSLITFGIGLLFLEPYMSAAMAEFYKDVKAEAIANGIMTEADAEYIA